MRSVAWWIPSSVTISSSSGWSTVSSCSRRGRHGPSRAHNAVMPSQGPDQGRGDGARRHAAGVTAVKVETSEMDREQKAAVMARARWKAREGAPKDRGASQGKGHRRFVGQGWSR